jgi:zinc transporter ZupT
MLGASHNLITEGTKLDPGRVLAGILVGLLAIVVSNRLIRQRDTQEIADLHGDSAMKALLILGVMTAHSFAEGIAVGVSYASTAKLGIFITTAIAIHNIPEGLAICLVLIPHGTPIWKASLWSIFTSLPQPLMAVPAFIFVTAFEPFLPVGLGIAAGAMIWIVFSELIPEALESASGEAVGIAVTMAMVAVWVFQLFVLGHG